MRIIESKNDHRSAIRSSEFSVFDSSTAEIQTRNVATRVEEKRWDWSAYIAAAPVVIDHVICVEYTLHENFTPQVRTVCDRGSSARPYALDTNGWGTFKLRMRVIFDDGTRRQVRERIQSWRGPAVVSV